MLNIDVKYSSSQFVSLLSTLLSELLIFHSSCLLLGCQLLSFYLLCLLLEDCFDQDCSVLELISLWCQVELVIEMSVNLFSFTIFSQQSSEYSLSPDPQYFSGHSAFSTSSTFSSSSVVTFAFWFEVKSSSSSGVNFLFALHDETVFNKFSDKDSGVGLTNLLDLVGIHPDSLFSALENFRC